MCASVIVPTFEERETISATVIRSVPRSCASWMTRSATWIEGGSVYAVEGETRPSASTAVAVTSLKVEPGSYVSSTARFRCTARGTVPKRFASSPGTTAIARMSPVRGSRTTALALRACHCASVRRSTSSAFDCSVWSSVR
jgi:hypothetical protein